MENTPNQENNQLSDRQVLEAILKNTTATKNFIKWQLIITVALVVIPLLAMVIILPMVMNSLTSMYGAGGVMQNFGGM